MSLWELPSVNGDVVNHHNEPEEAAEPEEPEVRLPTEEEVEAIREEARQAGFEEGREAGYAEGERKAEAAGNKTAKKAEKEQRQRLRILDDLIQAQARPLEQLDEEVQDQMLSLVLTLARQVIRRELQIQPGEILGVIREAVAMLPLTEREVTVRVHPDDHRFLHDLLGEESGERAWSLVDDPALSRGGCVVQAQRARVDASLETRLAQLASQLLGAREEDLHRDDEEPIPAEAGNPVDAELDDAPERAATASHSEPEPEATASVGLEGDDQQSGSEDDSVDAAPVSETGEPEAQAKTDTPAEPEDDTSEQAPDDAPDVPGDPGDPEEPRS